MPTGEQAGPDGTPPKALNSTPILPDDDSTSDSALILPNDTSDPEVHRAMVACLDSGATGDVLGGEDCERATDVDDLTVARELGTAGDTVLIKQTGDCVVGEGLELQGAWMPPWMSHTQISLSTRLAEGYSLVASGTKAVLLSPANKAYQFIVKDGLFVSAPGATSSTHDVSHAHDVSDEVAYKSASAPLGYTVAKAAALTMLLLLLGAAVPSDMVATGLKEAAASIPSDLLLKALPMLTTTHELLAKSTTTKTAVVPKRVHHKKQSSQQHCASGHCPHDPDCDVCRMARMRDAPATKRSPDAMVEDSDKGYVLGLDYFGPFEPDVDGNVHGLYGVETGHTKVGFVQLQKDRSFKGAN